MKCVFELACRVGWDGLTALGTLALVLIGLVTALYAGIQLSDFRRESRVKHLNDLVNDFEDEPMAAYRRGLAAKRVAGGVLQPVNADDPPPELHKVMNFFEHMGYLLAGRYLELDDIFVEFHYWILHVWADAREVVRREQAEEPIYYEYFEKMVKRLGERERQRTGRFELPSKTDIEDFYLEEAQLPSGSPIPRQRRTKRRSM